MNQLSIPVIGLAVAVFVLIFLVLRTRVHPLIAMLLASCIAGLTGGMSVNETTDAITRGFGSTLGTIGIIIGLGVMMGRILEVSGAAEQIALSLIKWLGIRYEAWAFAITGYFVSIPIFADSAFVILFPIAKASAIKGNSSIITMGIALAGGLVVTHTMVPPTPGPLGVAGIFGIEVGAMMLLGLILAIPCTISFVLYALWLGKKYQQTEGNTLIENMEIPREEEAIKKRTHPLPSLTLSLLPIVVPIGLIFLKALINLLPATLNGDLSAYGIFVQIINFAVTPFIALCISTLLAVYTLVPYLDRKEIGVRLEEGLQSAGIILMVTGAGGALGFVVRESGAGTQLASQIARLPFSPVMIPFFVATVVRLIQGSGTVAMITAASITAPILAQVEAVNMLFAAQSAVIGAFCFSYFNDSLFWVVNRMMGITEIKKQLLAWSVPTTIAWATGGVLIALINLLFGKGGTLLDPIIPLLGLGIILLLAGRTSIRGKNYR